MAPNKAAKTEFIALSAALKRCPGEFFERHAHPAVLLDHATGPSARVWGWGSHAQQKLLWCSDRGWSATVVEPDGPDTPGYELTHQSHRLVLLNRAMTGVGSQSVQCQIPEYVAPMGLLPNGSGRQLRQPKDEAPRIRMGFTGVSPESAPTGANGEDTRLAFPQVRAAI